ncbi:dihydrolipoyl dehydrogenase [Treponema primitia]|uniref:dihydrolipoyl dehydrogenase n=1 Tax=Treponema primitia TaxID=88058 RepID=UPI00398009DE
MYDTIIIGAGPGGYLAAERLGHHKKKVLLIEEQHLGGTCLNVGCIPTKTLLNSAKLYVHAKEAGKFGVTAADVSFDWGVIQKWKEEVSAKLREGIAGQMKRFGVDVANGRGEILTPPRGSTPGKVKVTLSGGGTEEHEGRTILVSAGSVPAIPPIPGSKDNPRVVDSTGLLGVSSVPKRLAVIGGGVIGVEFAGLFSSFGSEVTVIEMMDEIIPFMDKEQAPLFRRALTGVNFKLGCKVEKIEGATVHFTPKGKAPEAVEADLVLVAVGRRPVLNTWGAEAAGLDLTPKGVNVDDRMRTNIPGVWAAGDVTGKSLLAHSAYRMAEVAVADILTNLDGSAPGTSNRMRYNAVPWAVYGVTEAAGVGMTEQEAAAKGIAIRKASLPMRVSGRFAAENTFTGQGAVKVIADAATGCILGVHAVGAYASEFIWGGAALIEQELRIEDVKQIIFPHPTVSELIRDAVWGL